MPTCTQPKCRIAETGVCLEGHKQNCPHFTGPEANPAGATNTLSATSPAGPSVPEPYRFHSGEKLTVAEASRIMNGRPVRMILCAGAQWAGKTTFLARIGEMFRDGSFRKFRFAGSKTLCAFERATWHATLPSGAARPETRRSDRREADTFLHIRTYPDGESTCHKDVLISDLPGEIFPEAVALRDFCAKQRAIARADDLVLFLDCRSLVDTAKRHAEQDNVLRFMGQVASVKHDFNRLRVHVVFSRWDYVSCHPQRREHEDYCNGIEAKFEKRYGTSIPMLKFWRIAARPDGLPPTDDEIQGLFCHWLEAPQTVTEAAIARKRDVARDFSAFGL
jgi:hypothetical protein